MPMELFTLLGSGLLSFLMSMWGQSMKDRNLQNQMLLARGKLQNEMIEKARQMQGKGVSFTRRLIALTVVFSTFLLPKIAAMVWGISMTVGYTEYQSGFWFFTEGHEVTKWMIADGLTLTPLDTHGAMAVIGFYFGSRLGR